MAEAGICGGKTPETALGRDEAPKPERRISEPVAQVLLADLGGATSYTQVACFAGAESVKKHRVGGIAVNAEEIYIYIYIYIYREREREREI